MEIKPLEVIPKIPQYDDIEYARDYVCPECNDSGFMNYGFKVPKIEPNVIGWVETNYGKMGVFQCPFCGTKYRFHCGQADKFEYRFVQYYARRCPNWWKDFGEKLGLKQIKVEM